MTLAKRQCALCKNLDVLRLSHLIPEFIYKPIYDQKHRFIQVSTDPSRPTHLHQKGLREFLLCDTCESRLSAWESYAKGVIYGGIELQRRPNSNGFVFSPIDYSKFKLFAMSLLWRAGVSTRPEFSNVRLGRHEEVLRGLLLRGSPGAFWEYGFSMVFIGDIAAKKAFGETLVLPETIQATKDLTICRFLMGSLAWLFPISDGMQGIDARYFSLSENGELHLRQGGPEMTQYLARLSSGIAARTKRK